MYQVIIIDYYMISYYVGSSAKKHYLSRKSDKLLYSTIILDPSIRLLY